jgi:uncharacterized protein
MSESIGTLEAVRRYPVKSLRGEALDAAVVDEGGIPGDRAGALFVRTGNARVGETYRGKEHDRLHLFDDVALAQTSAAQRGVKVEFREAEHFFDDAPISLLVDRWLDSLNRHLGYIVEWERFRPNFFVVAATTFTLVEGELVNAELQLGGVTLRVRSPIVRCVTTTYHPQGKTSDPEILRFLAQQRDALMGVYCDVLEPGIARLGDQLKRRRRPAPLSPTPGGAKA